MSESPQFGPPPSDLDFEKSLMFFHAYMYGPLQGKLRLYGARKIPPGSVTSSSDWEVFGSMLVKDLGRKFGAGIDLANYEVKSAKRGGSYEYQYHKNTGRQKLARDMEVGHLFFEYFDNLKEVKLRYLHVAQLGEFFERWLIDYPSPYQQRYRKSIPSGFVNRNGTVLMVLKDGELVYPTLVRERPPTSTDGEPGEPDQSED